VPEDRRKPVEINDSVQLSCWITTSQNRYLNIMAAQLNCSKREFVRQIIEAHRGLMIKAGLFSEGRAS